MMTTKWLPMVILGHQISSQGKRSRKQHTGGGIRAADIAADGQTKGVHGYSCPTETTGPEGGGATSFLFHLKAHQDKKVPILFRNIRVPRSADELNSRVAQPIATQPVCVFCSAASQGAECALGRRPPAQYFM